MAKYKYILFDLDGTVSESAEGIRKSLEYAINTLGAKMPDLDDYTLYIGPPLIDTFIRLVGLDPETAERGAELYREYYNEKGKFLNRAYDGIEEVLVALKADGAKTALCTSKFEGFAVEIIDILGLADCFDAVCGSNLDGSRKDKKDMIPYAVRALGGSMENDRQSVVMLGDTWFDAKGARLCGVDFIGVKYGYGAVEPMEREGAVAFADSPQDILPLLG